MTKMKFALAAALGLAIGHGAASAETLSEYVGTFNQTAFDGSGNLTIAIPQFALPDPGAQLASATISFAGISQPQLTVFNLGSVSGTGMGMTTASYMLTGDAVSLTETVSSGLVTVSVAGGFGNSASSTPPSPFVFGASQAISNLAAFTGSGTTNLNLNQSFTTSGSTSTPGANLAYGGNASSNFGVTVTFNVPEPTSMALLGAGLIGMVLVVRPRARG